MDFIVFMCIAIVVGVIVGTAEANKKKAQEAGWAKVLQKGNEYLAKHTAMQEIMQKTDSPQGCRVKKLIIAAGEDWRSVSSNMLMLDRFFLCADYLQVRAQELSTLSGYDLSVLLAIHEEPYLTLRSGDGHQFLKSFDLVNSLPKLADHVKQELEVQKARILKRTFQYELSEAQKLKTDKGKMNRLRKYMDNIQQYEDRFKSVPEYHQLVNQLQLILGRGNLNDVPEAEVVEDARFLVDGRGAVA